MVILQIRARYINLRHPSLDANSCSSLSYFFPSMPPFSSFLAQTSTSQSSMPSPTSSKEASQQLSNESFSFGWLAGDVEPSFEAGPDVLSRHRSSASDAYEFDFGLSRPLSPALAHADQIFSNGFLLPLHVVVSRSKSETTSESSSGSSSTLSRSLSLDSSDSYLSFSNRYQSQRFPCNAAAGRLAPLEDSPHFPTTSSSSSSSSGGGATKNTLPFLESCARKYLCFLLPWSKTARRRWRLLGSKTTTTTTTKGRTPPTAAAGDAFSTLHLCRGNRISDNSHESAINDAILHCKRSVSST